MNKGQTNPAKIIKTKPIIIKNNASNQNSTAFALNEDIIVEEGFSSSVPIYLKLNNEKIGYSFEF